VSERTFKLAALTESLSAALAHADDFVVWGFLAHLADRVEPVLLVIALDPNLMPERPTDRRELFGIGRAMLLVLDEIILLIFQSLLDGCVVGSHQTNSLR
jgi:hypothetical protein